MSTYMLRAWGNRNSISLLIVKRGTNRFTTAPMLLDMTLRLLVFIMLIIDMAGITSVLLRPVATDTPQDLTVRTRRISSATSTPRRTLARSPSRSARRLLTPHTLRSVRRLSPLTVRKLMRRFITAPMLLVMTHRLWLMEIMAAMAVMAVMEVIIRSFILKI